MPYAGAGCALSLPVPSYPRPVPPRPVPVEPDRAPDRVRWAVQVLDPRPGELVLDVGGGPGLSTALLLAGVAPSGRVVAVDRSEVACERTRSRNRDAVAAGTLEVVCCPLAAARLGAGTFDAALAVDVNVFWTSDASAELAVLRAALRAGGRLLLAWGAGGPTGPERVLPTVVDGVRRAGLVDVQRLAGDGGAAVLARAPA
jgi:SAM-dependent methyltransferase